MIKGALLVVWLYHSDIGHASWYINSIIVTLEFGEGAVQLKGAEEGSVVG